MSNHSLTASAPQTQPDAESLTIFDCLREAASEALERKQRLGQYYAQWTPEGIQLIAPDAPKQTNADR